MSSNSIYSFQNVLTFLQDIGAQDTYHAKRGFFIKTNHPALYDEIFDYTSVLTTATFTERLYCYANKIPNRPLCKKCNSKHVTYSSRHKEYHTYCSQSCSIKDMESLLGVVNPSQLQSVKDKKKQSALDKYGVDNVSKSSEVKLTISKKVRTYWGDIYKDKDFTADGLTRQQYSHRCQTYADTQYRRYKHILDPEGKRSKHWHIDHIYSVTDGFLNNVPINIISDVTNLRLISSTENYKKTKNSHKSLAELYEDFNNHERDGSAS